MNSIWKKYSVLLVYLAAALLAVSDTGVQLLILNTIGSHSRILRQMAIWLLFFKVTGTRYTKREFLLLAPIAVLSLYNYTLCGNIYCIWNILIIAAMKDVDFSTLFKVLFYSTLTFLVTVSVLSLAGIGSAASITMDFGRGSVETRYCPGMYHPNIWHFAFARCIVFFALGYERYLKWYTLFALLAANFLAYRFTVSRTGLFAVTAFLIFLFACKYLGKLMHCIYMKAAIMGGLLAAFGVYLYFLYDYAVTGSRLAEYVNSKLTTGRIEQAVYYLSRNPIKLMGSRFPDDGTVFDCGILRMFFESGWLLAGIFVIAFLILLFFALKNHLDGVTATCIFMAMYSLYEANPATRPSYNIIVFFMAILLYKRRELSC